jgi:hypothetical protein
MQARRVLLALLGVCALVGAFALAGTASVAAKAKHQAASRDPSGVAMPVGNKPGWKQVFKDDFKGTELDSKWDKYNGVVGGGKGGWWARSHAVVHDGELVLETYSDPADCKNATSCPLFNNEVSGGAKTKFSMTYGKVLVRVKTTPVADVSFLALLWPVSDIAPPETDFIVEGGSDHLTTIGAMLKYLTTGSTGPTGPTGATGTTGPVVVPDSVTANAAKWHTLGVVWSKGELQYTIDGHVWATEINPKVSSVPSNIVLQSQTTCQAVAGQACTEPWAAKEPNADIAWVVAYKRHK